MFFDSILKTSAPLIYVNNCSMELWLLLYLVAAFLLGNDVASSTRDNRQAANKNVHNSLYSLETDKVIGEAGNTFVFYISFMYGIFRTADTTFQVDLLHNTISENVCYCSATDRVTRSGQMYGNVQTFSYLFEKEGNYSVLIAPFAASVINTTLRMEIEIYSKAQNGCQNVGKFLIDNRPVSPFPDATLVRKNFSDWTVISRANVSCDTWQARKSKWTLEKIHVSIPPPNITSQCLNMDKIRKVNIENYTSYILNIPLPPLGRESGFVIQPFMLPPGYYRICNTVVNKDVSLIHCGLLALLPEPNDCRAYIDSLRIETTPDSEIIASPIRDMTIKIKYYSVYALPEVGYIGLPEYTHTWTCSGDVLCKSLQQNIKVKATEGETYKSIPLIGQGTELFIPSKYQTANTSVTFWIKMYFRDPLTLSSPCRKDVQRIIQFKSSVYGTLSIRCYLNCWKLMNPERPILLGLSCDGCKITQVNQPVISWTVIGLSDTGMITGQYTSYIIITDSTSRGYPWTFTVMATLRYQDSEKNYEEITLSKVFRAAATLPGNIITVANLIEESQENSQVIPGELAASFQRFDLSLFDFIKAVQTVAQLPVVITIAFLPEVDDEGYVLLRTVWAPLDFCIESVKNLSTPLVKMRLSATDGRANVQLDGNIYDLQNRQVGPYPDIEKLWLLTQDNDSFTVNDQTYLGVITQAIEAAAKDIEPLADSTDTKLLPVIANDNQAYLESGNLINIKLDEEENFLAISEGSTSPLSVRRSIVSTTLPEIVERILDSLNSNGENGLTYSNIDLFLVSLIRLLSIKIFSPNILAKGVMVLQRVHSLHETILEDPTSDDDLIRLKLKALHTITVYFLECRRRSIDTSKYAADIISLIVDVTEDIPRRLVLKYPTEMTIASNNATAKALWLDPFQEKNDLNFDLAIVKLTITMEGLRSGNYHFSMNTFVNVAVYTDDKCVLQELTSFDVWPNTPVLHISVTMKQPLEQPFFVNSPEAFTLKYDYDFQNAATTDLVLNSSIYATKQKNDRIAESDCFIFKMEADTQFANILTFQSASNLKLGVKVKLANLVSGGIKAVDSEELILPRTTTNTICPTVATDPYSLFLPAMTLRQQAELRGTTYYYVILRIKSNQAYKVQNVQQGPSELLQVGEEQIIVKCLKISCMQWTNSYLTTKYCYVTPCSGGTPPIILCRCSRGDTFIAGTGPCKSSQFTLIKRDEVRLREFDLHYGISYLIPIAILALWLIFLAILRSAHRFDTLERPLGNTYAIEGVFSPFISDQYLVCISTGFGRGYGTKSVPYMTIVGTEKITPRYRLETGDYLFQNGSELWLMVSIPYHIGRLEHIVLSLEPENWQLSSWYVEEVYIKRLISGEEWNCSFKSWIPDSHNHNSTYIVTDTGKRENGSSAFGSILIRLLRNQHPVFGIGYCIPGSYFTKAQHVIFCFCGLCILMLICLLTHGRPTPKLVTDPVLKEVFSLDTEMYNRAAFCALIAVLPIYVLGILLESARAIDTHSFEWRPLITQSGDTAAYEKMMTPEKSENQSSDGDNIYSDGALAQTSSSVDTTPYIKRLQTKNVTKLRHNNRYLASRFAGWFDFAKLLNSSSSLKSSPVDEYPSDICSHYQNIRKQQQENSSLLKAYVFISRVFRLPVAFYLTLMIIISVVISYYIIMLGFYISTAGGLMYLYVVFAAFIILMVVLYPLLLVAVAVLNNIMYLNGLWYYGVRTESDSRIETMCKLLPGIKDMVHLDVYESRTRLLGNVEDQNIRETNTRMPRARCKDLIHKKKVLQRKHLAYTNPETFLFIVIILAIINLQSGAVWTCFRQSSYLIRLFEIGRDADITDVALKTEDVWDHLTGIFSAIISWRQTTFHMTILSSIRVRQIRAKPYQGDCVKDFPDLIQPQCRFRVEDSTIETTSYPTSWLDTPLAASMALPGPYTYTPGEYLKWIFTPTTRYPDGGYDALFSESNIDPCALTNLRKSQWIDEYTKAVVIDVNFLNIDSGLCSIMQHIYEFKPAGIFMYTTEFYTFPLTLSQSYYFAMSCLILALSLMTAYFLIFEIKNCFQLGPVAYFKLPQSWFLLLERLLSVAIIIIYLSLEEDKKDKLHQIIEARFAESEYPVYIDFPQVPLKIFTLITIGSVLVAMCLIKAILKFRENIHFGGFVNLIRKASVLVLIPLMNTTSFAILGYLLFNSVLKYYYTLRNAISTIIVMNLQVYLVATIIEATAIIGKLYIASLYCVSRYLVYNFFIVLLNEAFSELKRQHRLLNG